MTKLLITEKLITNKQEFINLSSITDSVEFISFEEFISDTTLSLFSNTQLKFIFDKFVNYSELLKRNHDFSSNYIFQIKKNSLTNFSEVSTHVEVIQGSKPVKDKYLPWDLSNLIFNQKNSLNQKIVAEFCLNENLFRQFLAYLNKELMRVNLLQAYDQKKVSILLNENIDFKYELALRRLENINKKNLDKSFEQINKIEKLISKSGFNQENGKRFIVGMKKLLEF